MTARGGMMNDTLTFRWAEPGDLPAYEAFVAETYGPDSIQAIPGRARWLYWENPLGLHVALCLQGERIVGACGHLPYPVVVGGEPLEAAFGIDMMVAPELRRRGIARKLLEMRLARFELSLSSGQSNEMAALYETASAEDLGPMMQGWWRRQLPRPGRPRRFLRELASWARPRLRTRAGTADRRPIELDEAARFIDGWTNHGSVPGRASRWEAWFRWRYGGTIYGDHRFWHVRVPKSVQGILVSRIEKDQESIVQCFCAETALPAFLRAAGRTSPESEVSLCGSGRELAGAMSAAGYLSRSRASRIVAVSASGRLTSGQDLRNVVLWAGASDIDLLRWPHPERTGALDRPRTSSPLSGQRS